jgi:hypothetical protein
MRLPASIDKVTIVKNTRSIGVFPPVGFVEFEEGNDGGGDYYGLYWELGKEKQLPIVCRVNHEEYTLEASSPDLNSFILWFEKDDKNIPVISNLDNDTFFPIFFFKAKVLAKNGKAVEAIEKLELSTRLFGEFSESWALLSEQYRKVGRIEDAEHAAINSIRANWAFGLPSNKAVDCFQAIDVNGHHTDEPLAKRKDDLIKPGTFNSPPHVNFENLLGSIEAYKAINDTYSYLKMKQNYGYFMNAEKKETKEKYDFDRLVWNASFVSECNQLVPDRLILSRF